MPAHSSHNLSYAYPIGCIRDASPQYPKHHTEQKFDFALLALLLLT